MLKLNSSAAQESWLTFRMTNCCRAHIEHGSQDVKLRLVRKDF